MKKEIEIIVNDREEKIPEKVNISQLIDLFKEGDEHLIVAYNGKIILPQEYTTTVVSSGDKLHFIHPDFGG